jgi:predicted AlkP superfamily pyrophosphatase or phosphodiesterase
MRKCLLAALLLLQLCSIAQSRIGVATKPKLVVGIMVDHMRWDYLYRYQYRYGQGGFNRLMKGGYTCNNVFIPYTPTATACGHSCVYTGTVPAINGITGNNWWDAKLQQSMYCVEDKTVKTVGSNTNDGEMSPRNLKSNTVTDELRLATNFKSKVIGISIKDRGAILPAGHAANAAYWYDEARGVFVSSTFYMQQLPAWAQQFNSRKLADQYYAQGWKTLYPLDTYTQSDVDSNNYERIEWMGVGKSYFPYELSQYIGKDYGKLPYIPQGNTYTLEMAKAAIEGEQLGATGNVDFLAVSLSGPDYMAHSFGPNSVEAEDMYLRLDKDLELFLQYLDKKVGAGAYTVFLTADHGGSHIPAFLNKHHLPGGSFDSKTLIKKANEAVKKAYGVEKVIIHQTYYNLTLNEKAIDSAHISLDSVKRLIIKTMEAEEGVYRVVDKAKFETSGLPSVIKERLINGYYPSRSGHLQIVPEPAWMKDTPLGADHSIWNPYDAHIPLVFYGWGIKQGKNFKEAYMTDIAPTIAALLRIQMPNGCIGKVIEDVLK